MKIRTLLCVVMAIALASTARAQTKTSGTLHCNKPDPAHSIDVGDHEKHSMTVTKFQCTWTKPFEMGGSETKEGPSVELGETTGDKSSGRGVHWGTMANGDKYFVRYQGTSTSKDGAPPTISGTWSYTGGTGKLKGLTGKGTYKGKGNPDGSATFDVVGDYKLP
jgi:hypothetical protein